MLFIIPMWTFIAVIDSRYLSTYHTPSECDNSSYFDIVALSCVKCGANRGQEHMQVASKDGSSCQCIHQHKIISHESATKLSCASCPPEHVTSLDGWDCVPCAENSPFQPTTESCSPCMNGVYEEVTGSDGVKRLECTLCNAGTWPNTDSQKCVTCPEEFLVANGSVCSCPADKYIHVAGSCIPAEKVDANIDSLYSVKYQGGSISSEALRSLLLPSLYNCKEHGNESACEALANLCVLTLYHRSSESAICDKFLALSEPSSGLKKQSNQRGLPWLFYLDDDASLVISRTDVPNQFTIKHWKNSSYLHFIVAKYSLEGKLTTIGPLRIRELSLCGTSLANKDALRFGTTFAEKCQKPTRDLWDESLLVFYDVFLEGSHNGVKKIYPVPVKIENFEKNSRRNSEDGASSWQLVRRFFLVDPITGKDSDSASRSGHPKAKFLRYAEKVNLHITLHKKGKPGSIHPPLITIGYAEASRDAYEQNAKLPLSFSITYSSDFNQAAQDMPIALGVLSAFAILWACIQTWSWTRRSGKLSINIVTLVKLIIYTCSSLSSVFLVVVLCTCLNWLLMYKLQDVVHMLLPSPHQENSIELYIIFAFVMKTLYLLHVVFLQSSADIFFLDWERPHATSGIPRPGRREAPRLSVAGDGSQAAGLGDASSNSSSVVVADHKGGESATAVSIWRSYFVANEWCELQCHRRVSLSLQLLTLLLLLKGLGLEYVALASPESYYSRTVKNADIPFSAACRFALSASLYLLIALFQVVLQKFIYERFYEDKLQHFIDLCSVSNISVVIFVQPKFGYYIHGRSAQGHADVSMKEMHELLRREEEDLCGHRGLLPDTEQQTFQMTLPVHVYEQYCRMRRPLSTYAQAPERMQNGDGQLSRVNIDTVVNTYNVVTKFLCAFLDHSLKDVDYTVKDRTVLEKLLDIELNDIVDRGFFYNDNGHSFDAVIYHGHEFTLVLWDLLMFCVVDFASSDFILAATLTYVVDKMLEGLRRYLSRRNLVKKALVDERFLW
ncbi:meckelin isoform X1 [Dermacentor albipictus]|uniref:meckelin isoform X1 n=1 Tax=Dermacentor albipictus TaxID=60249 RepID=UPI0031FC3D95